tara:strand:- start:45 stop:785 length:741 start_codon:yes stop_codon:yes gene_type:complete
MKNVEADRVWIVTGASRGIGLAVATCAAEAGARVVLLARGQEVTEVAKKCGPQCIGFSCDVTNSEEVKNVVEEIFNSLGRIDVVVNNAGFHRGGKISRLEQKDWKDVLNTNLTGAMNVIQHSSAYLDQGSAIVNVGAVVGFRGFPGDSAYAASKAGLGGLTRALAIELAVKGVTVNMVIPGLVLTDMTRNLSEKALESMRNTIPLKRYGQAQEVAEVVCWVASSTYMTGAFVPVDGGLMSSFGVPG